MGAGNGRKKKIDARINDAKDQKKDLLHDKKDLEKKINAV